MKKKSEVQTRRDGSRKSFPLNLGFRIMEPVAMRDVTGRTVEISSEHLLFVAQGSFALGLRLGLKIDWPVYLEDGVPLTLNVSGRVIRSADGNVVIEIEKHSFRVGRRQPLSAHHPETALKTNRSKSHQASGTARHG